MELGAITEPVDPLASERPLIMGILNVTPDSFSDGGRFFDFDKACEHGLEMAREGADVVDVGGESSRPGADPVPEAEEIRRVIEVVSVLAPVVRVSVDTVKPAVAEAAVGAGATLINDVSATLAQLSADLGVGWVAMHSRGNPANMSSLVDYSDVVGEVMEFLASQATAAKDLGVAEVWVDPGIGFAKTAEQNLALLAATRRLSGLGFPLLVGTSRKSFLGQLTSWQGEIPPPQDRFEASLATATWAMLEGARMVRVHDVPAAVDAASVVHATRDASHRL